MTTAVLFDLDGTLVDSERQNQRALARVMAVLGRPLDADEEEFVIGHGWREIDRKLAERGPLPVTLDELMARAGQERARLLADEGEQELPGARRVVGLAAGLGRVGLVSGSSRAEIVACLQHLDVQRHVATIVGAEDVPRGKPDPDGYLLAAERLAVAPAACVVFEDSTAGIFAARAAGMHVVGVAAGNFARQDQSGAHEIVASLAEVDEAWLRIRFGAAR